MFRFSSVKISDRDTVGYVLDKYGLSFSDHCFGGLYIWQDAYKTEFAVYDDTVILRGEFDGKRFYQAPVGKNFEHAVEYLIENDPENLFFLSVSGVERERIERSFPGKFEFTYDRDNSDYVYKKDELQSFSGKKFQQKRNHVNRFIKLYGEPNVIRLCNDNIREIIEAEGRWFDEKGSDDPWLIREKDAVKRCVESFDELSFFGAALVLDGRIAAFGIGERLGKNAVLEHFEKADRNIEGCYSVMTREFARILPQDVEFINREEDMGLEGLRKAKLSLKPVRLEDKYDGRFIG